MLRGKTPRRQRRGTVMAEAGIVYSLAILLVLGTIVMGLGIFRYQEIAYQARQGARWASLQSTTPSSSDVLTTAIKPILLQSKLINATVTKSTINSVDYISVKLTYRWVPEVFPSIMSPVTFSSTSTQPISP